MAGSISAAERLGNTAPKYNVAAMASHYRDGVRFEGPGIEPQTSRTASDVFSCCANRPVI